MRNNYNWISALLSIVFISLKSFGQNSCSTAIQVTDLSGAICTTGSVSSNNTIGAASCQEGSYDSWFVFTAQGANATITITASSASFSPEFVVLKSDNNTCTGSFSYSSSNCFDGSGTYQTLTGIATDLDPGTNYWVVVTSGSNTITGTLDVCIFNPITPTNDVCADAAILPLDGTCITGTTQFSTDNISGLTGCQDGSVSSHPDVYYSFVADNPLVTFNLSAGTMTGNAEITVRSGSCSNYTTHGYLCGPMPLTGSLPAFVPGQTYFVIVSTSGTEGTFELCATSSVPVASPGQDCPNAETLCDLSNFSVGTINAGGGAITGNSSVEDLTFAGSCFGGQESQAQWYQFSVNETGDLEFQIIPETWDDDYDWAVFDITTTGCVIKNNVPISCNWSACPGMTGITANVSQFTGGLTNASDYYNGPISGGDDCSGVPGSPDNDPGGSQWENAVTVTAGRKYAILINNYSNTSNDGFQFFFNGTDAGLGTLAGFKQTGGGCTDYTVSIEDTIQAPNSVSYTWNWGDGSPTTIGSSSETHDFTSAGAGTYQVQISVTDLIGCTKEYYMTVSVGTTLAAHAGSDLNICEGSTVSLGDAQPATGGNGVYTYAWSPDNNSLTDVTISNPNATPLSTTSYTLTVTDGLGCSASDNVLITVNPIPSVSNVSTAQTICSGENAVFNPTSNVVGTTFNWTTTAGVGISGHSISGNGTINELITNSGITSEMLIYSITPTATSCTGTPIDFTVTVNPIPTYSANGTNPSLCGAGDGFITVSGVSPSTSVDYSYSVNGTLTNTSSMSDGSGVVLISNLVAGSYTNFSVSDPGTGCSSTPQIITLSNPGAPLLSIPSNIVQCGGTYILPAITGTGLTGNQSYYSGPGATGTNYLPGTIISTIGTTPLYIYDSNGGACTDEEFFTITINPVPSLSNALLTQTVCSETSISFFPNSNTLGTSFTWSTSTNGTNLTGYSINGTGNINEIITNTGATTESITYTIVPSTSFCSGNPTDFVVTVHPTATIINNNTSTTICSGEHATMQPLSIVSGTTFSWTASTLSEFVTGYSNNGNGAIDDLIENSSSTMDSLEYTIVPDHPNGCPGNPVIFKVYVKPIPTISNTPSPTNVCSGGIIQYIPESTVTSTTFSWTATASSGSITGFSGNGTGAINEQILNSGTSSGTLTYSIVASASSCSDTPFDYVINVHPLPVISGGNDQTICEGTSTTLSGNGGNSYVWDNNIFNGISFSPGIGTSIYTVTGTDANNCSNTDQVSITVNPSPSLTLSFDSLFICSGESITISPGANVSGTTFTWTAITTNDNITGFSANGNGSIQETLSNTGLNTGNVLYIITPTLGTCSGEKDTCIVIVHPLPTAPSILGTNSYCSYTIPSSLTAIGSGGTGTFEWFSDENLTNSIGFGATIQPDNTIGTVNYYVVETVNGCNGESAVGNVTINTCEIIIPTAFTPDQDNTNDVWEIINIDQYFPNNRISVYNRWGTLLYQSDEGAYANRPWDGKYDGKDLPVASYYFIVDFNDGTTDSKTGIVSIIKK